MVCFNGHPPLGVNATDQLSVELRDSGFVFQRAPTLGGECYIKLLMPCPADVQSGFNGHPPLGVNATERISIGEPFNIIVFQRAPTLGGECYRNLVVLLGDCALVSTGTHPWG